MLKAEVNGTHVTVEMHGSGLTPYADVMRLLLSVYDGLEKTMVGAGDALLAYISDSMTNGEFLKCAREGTEKT